MKLAYIVSEYEYTAYTYKIHKRLIYKDLISRVTFDPDVCHGKPSIRGLRYPVEIILELLASGMTNDEILDDYEDLELADIQACILFAAKLAKVKNISKLVA